MGLAHWWDEAVVPRLVKTAASAGPIMKLRSQTVPLARGKVLELGCGGGLNQQFLQADLITSYSGLDPSAKGLDYTRTAAAAKGWDVDIRQGFGEAMPFDDESFDTVVCTLTLCSVDDHAQTIAEIRRVLKPGGTYIFLEHGRAPDAGVAATQRRIEPVWKRLLGGCHLTRPVTPAIAKAGFAVAPLGTEYMKKMPRFAGYMEWGTAIRQG
jgi:ubiquinone/menaquinone biosynthesis C-methylase UbiE